MISKWTPRGAMSHTTAREHAQGSVVPAFDDAVREPGNSLSEVGHVQGEEHKHGECVNSAFELFDSEVGSRAHVCLHIARGVGGRGHPRDSATHRGRFY
jgi:hypothetical protein